MIDRRECWQCRERPADAADCYVGCCEECHRTKCTRPDPAHPSETRNCFDDYADAEWHEGRRHAYPEEYEW
jgi:hypothetical protein